MKVLSLAMVGAFGYVGVASAACPTSPAQPVGAWNAVTEQQASAKIVSPGYAGTECRLDSSINAGAGLLANGSVRYSQATTEPRVRVHFIVNVDNISAPVSADKVRIFGASSTGGGSTVDFTVYGFGGNKVLNYTVRNADGSTNGGTTPLVAGPNHVEFDLQSASAANASDGYFKLWINSNTEAGVTASKTNLANFGKGADRFTLGLTSPSREFVTNHATKTIGFDQFDSRRTTFIGY